MNQTKTELILQIILHVVTVMAPLLAIAFRQWAVSAASQKKNALAILYSLAEVAVSDLEREVRALKDPDHPGEWSPSSQQAIKEAAMRYVRRLGAAELDIVLATLSKSEAGEFLDKLVEAQVELAKQRRAPTSPPELPSDGTPGG